MGFGWVLYGKKGAEAGDPLSPHLFVLALEVFSKYTD